jgi:hypothetical protein
MKSLNFIILITILSHACFAESSPEKVNPSAPTILVIGFEKDNLTSNYYGDDYLSKQFGISEDSLHLYYFSSIFNKLKSINPLQYKNCNNKQNLTQFHNIINRTSAITENSNESIGSQLSDLLDQHNSEFILYINQYQINWSGQPFNTIVHLMDYALFDRNNKEVLNGQMFFNSEEITPLFSQKKAERRIKQLVQRIERAVNK